VCTVVKRDRSMEALIDNGEDWMQPLVEIRDFLYGTIDREAPDYNPEKYRMPIRRNKAEGLGPYWPKWRYHILKMILEAQKIAQEEDPQNQLITLQELAAIQVVWNRDHIYEYSVADLYNDVFDKAIDFDLKGSSIIQEKKILKEVCQDTPDDFTLINRLLNAQKNKVLLLRKHGLQNDLESILQEHVRPTFTKLEEY
jgi:DNA sulfur modification protein DndC